MKKVATTQFRNEYSEFFINEYEDGTFEKVENEEATPSSSEELQRLIDSGLYKVQNLTW